MSAINTNSLNQNYPVAGVNNDTQGFRDNFTNIKNNLNTAATEITDLQNKAVVKSALTNSTVNNDMANTLISNALVRSFRASTYNIGNNVTTDGEQNGTWILDVSKGDVQYGTLKGNLNLQFGGWAPTLTQSNVQLILNVANSAANAVITLPNTHVGSDGQPTTGMLLSTRLLEGYISNRAPVADGEHTNQIRVPQGVNKLHYMFSTENCGATVHIVNVDAQRVPLQLGNILPQTSNTVVDGSGIILSLNDDDTIYGYNTAFTSQIQINDEILDAESGNVVGIVKTKIDNNHLNFYEFATINTPTTSKTGNITCTEGNATVTGSGTSFQSQIQPGDFIVDKLTLDTEGFTQFVGVVDAVISNTSLRVLDTNTLTAGAELTLTNKPFYVMRPYAYKIKRSISRGIAGDKKGMLATDGTNLYICIADYDGLSNIWKKVLLRDA